MSDLLSSCLATLCIYFSLETHRRVSHALLLGLCFSLALLTRLPNLLIIIPIAIVLVVNLKSQKQWWAIILGATPGCLFLLYVNHTLYGSPFASGYGNIWRLFKLEYFGITISHFSYWLAVLLTPITTIAFLASITLAKQRPFIVSLLWAWALCFLGFYVFYHFSHITWWYLRFILPAIPPIIIGAGFALQYATKKLGSKFTADWLPDAIAGSLIVLTVLLLTNASDKRVHLNERTNSDYLKLANWVNFNSTPDDIFLTMQTSGSLFYYSESPIVRYDLMTEGNWRLITNSMTNHTGKIYAALFAFEIDKRGALSEIAPGDWIERARFGTIRVMELQSAYVD